MGSLHTLHTLVINSMHNLFVNSFHCNIVKFIIWAYVIAVSPCSDDEFVCNKTSECISLKQRCNGDVDCTDGSDEANCCTLIVSLYFSYLILIMYRGLSTVSIGTL